MSVKSEKIGRLVSFIVSSSRARVNHRRFFTFSSMAGKKKASTSPETLDQPREKVLKTVKDDTETESAEATDDKKSHAAPETGECGRLIIVSYTSYLPYHFTLL